MNDTEPIGLDDSFQSTFNKSTNTSISSSKESNEKATTSTGTPLSTESPTPIKNLNNQQEKPIEDNQSNKTGTVMTNTCTTEFATEAAKRTSKIKHLTENIQKITELLQDNKTSQFYKQKTKQLESVWNSVLESTDKMIGNEYKEQHANEVNNAQDAYDGIIIKLNEKTSIKDGNMKLPEIQLPTFDGTYQNWLNFRDLFEKMIHESQRLTTV